jgi:hypothetical protein
MGATPFLLSNSMKCLLKFLPLLLLVANIGCQSTGQQTSQSSASRKTASYLAMGWLCNLTKKALQKFQKSSTSIGKE